MPSIAPRLCCFLAGARRSVPALLAAGSADAPAGGGQHQADPFAGRGRDGRASASRRCWSRARARRTATACAPRRRAPWIRPRWCSGSARTLETFLVKPLAGALGRCQVVALSEAPGVRLLPTREGGMWEAQSTARRARGSTPTRSTRRGEHATDEEHEHGEIDMHLWLDPQQRQALVAAIAPRSAPPIPAQRRHLRGQRGDVCAERLDGSTPTLRGSARARRRTARSWCSTMPISISSAATA